jgi:2-dehydro-3-deoxygluconokinase
MIPKMAPLNVPASGAIDFLALGALVHRLDPGIVPFRRASSCDVHVSGGEYNCAANLASCFRLRSAIATAMVDYPIGELIEARVRAMGVTPFYRRFAHDGVHGPNMALVYSDRGFGVRPPVVFYNRANEAAARLRPGDFDWSAIFHGGVRWFHSGGIFAALSESAPDLMIEAMDAAHARGAIVSFDFNYRDKLWDAAGGERRAHAVLNRIVEHVDVLVGAFDVEATRARFPNLKVIATTRRDVQSANRHRWSASAWIDGRTYSTPGLDLDIFDRVGSGDGFASGLFFGLLTGESPEVALRLGWAHGALVTTYPGDTTMATIEEVRAVAAGASAEIQR